MSAPVLRWRLIFALAFVAMMATACFQNIGDAENPNALSMGLPTETFTPFPTATDIPILDSTLDEAQLTLDAQSASDVLLSDTGGAFPTESPTPLTVAQDNNFGLTATVYVAEVTQTQAASFTQTAIARGLGATATPVFPTPTPLGMIATIDPFATIIVQPPVGQVCIHTVQLGDNLFRMSMLYGVSVNQLAAANGITNIQIILVGQQVTIPGCGTTGVYPQPTAIPTLGSGTGGFQTPGVGVSVPSQSASVCNTHIVEQYETLFEISLTYGVPMTSIINVNAISNSNIIIMGTTLQIPCA